MTTNVPVRTTGDRLRRLAAEGPVVALSRVAVRAQVVRLRLLHRFSRRGVVGDGEAVVNLTTWGHRTATVHLVVESIVAGAVRPRRMILWLDDRSLVDRPPPELKRLRRRGLELRACPDWGPHKKQLPFALTRDASGLPLVVADDDVVYPRAWLAGLLAAHHEQPDVVTGYRARTAAVDDGRMVPYAQWRTRVGTEASFSTICTGVSGVVYPPALVAALRDEGEGFVERAPTADDIWVHAVAAHHGIRTRQAQARHREFPTLPGTQVGALLQQNVAHGGNDRWVRTAYSARALDRIAADGAAGR